MSTVAEASPTPVTIAGKRGGPGGRTLRTDRWWLSPLITVSILSAFIVYATWAAFQNAYYYAGPSLGRNYLSPFYSPCIASGCISGSRFAFTASWWSFSPALLILIVPLGFRFTCYYYRRAYYRSFWFSPPGCAVADAQWRSSFKGESRFPLILQNVHRWFFYLGLILNVILTIDAIEAFRFGHGWGMGLGTLVMCVNAGLLWVYSLSCHACRHLCGGGTNRFSKHPIRYKIWKVLNPLNARHMQFAWASLIFVGLTDLYIRLVAGGVFHDPRFF